MAKVVVNKEKEEDLTPPDTDLNPEDKVEDSVTPNSKEDLVGVEAKGVYATEYFKRNNIPYCEKCGAQYQTGLNEEPICPENFTSANCPRLGN